MPDSPHAVYGVIVSAAAPQQTAPGKISAAFAALYAYLLLNFRTLIDQPQERQAVESGVVKAFNFLLGDKLGTAAEVVFDTWIVSTIDGWLKAIAVTPPAPVPVVVPAVPQGSAAP